MRKPKIVRTINGQRLSRTPALLFIQKAASRLYSVRLAQGDLVV